MLRQWMLVPALFAFLGITSTIGAIQHGNDPTPSVVLATINLSILWVATLPWKGRN